MSACGKMIFITGKERKPVVVAGQLGAKLATERYDTGVYPRQPAVHERRALWRSPEVVTEPQRRGHCARSRHIAHRAGRRKRRLSGRHPLPPVEEAEMVHVNDERGGVLGAQPPQQNVDVLDPIDGEFDKEYVDRRLQDGSRESCIA